MWERVEVLVHRDVCWSISVGVVWENYRDMARIWRDRGEVSYIIDVGFWEKERKTASIRLV